MYRVVVLVKDELLRGTLVQTLRFAHFEVRGYDRPEVFMAEIFDSGQGPSKLPDLAVIDLEIGAKTPFGFDLARELAERDVVSQIVVLSAGLSSPDYEELVRMGIKKLDKSEIHRSPIIRTLKQQARIGNRRKQYRSPALRRGLDKSRLSRPVFLSYNQAERDLAKGICRELESNGIGCWYAPNSIETGDEWTHEIPRGLEEASVFVALISPGYLKSPYCIAEFKNFQHRESGLKDRVAILPVIAHDLESCKTLGSDFFASIEGRYEFLDMSVRFVDRFTVLQWKITEEVKKHKARYAEKGAARISLPAHSGFFSPRADVLPNRSKLRARARKKTKSPAIRHRRGDEDTPDF